MSSSYDSCASAAHGLRVAGDKCKSGKNKGKPHKWKVTCGSPPSEELTCVHCKAVRYTK